MQYFYKHSNYFFDIRELVQHLRYSSKHPYTNVILNRFTKNQILSQGLDDAMNIQNSL